MSTILKPFCRIIEGIQENQIVVRAEERRSCAAAYKGHRGRLAKPRPPDVIVPRDFAAPDGRLLRKRVAQPQLVGFQTVMFSAHHTLIPTFGPIIRRKQRQESL